MDYPSFVAQGQSRWDEFERRLTDAQAKPRAIDYADLEALALLYRQVLHDHALAAARFAGTGVARRLSRLSLAATRFLYRNRDEHGTGFIRFWTTTFPRAFRHNLPNTLAAVFLFSVAALFGLFLASVQLGLATTLLGPGAVAGLESGHLWTEALLTSVPPSVSSSAIARNNVGVALAGWAGGALAGLGSLYILFMNGFLLGAVFGVTLHYSMADRLFEFVSAHGPLEISLILVTAGAGLRLGRALVEADELPRGVLLREGGRDALAILLGCLPWFVPLGFVEGVLSPSLAVPPLLKAVLGVSLLGLFLVAAWNPFLPEEAP